MANEFNKKFIKKFFPDDEEVGVDYPKVNYRLRVAGLTTFEPYYSEASKLSTETQSDYESRVNTSGKFYEEQEILLDNVANSSINVSGLSINSEYRDGRIPETLLYIEKCILSDDEKWYTVHPVCLNNENYLTNSSPVVVYPIGDIPEQLDGEESKKGWYVYRRTAAVQKYNNKLTEIHSGWDKIHEFSSKDIHDVGIDEGVNVARRFVDSGVSGFSGWTNEIFTDYKVIDSGVVENAETNINDYITKPRTVNYLADPGKAYTIERKLTRESNLTKDNPATWEVIESAATFPYKDSERFSETVTKDLNFEISGTYDIVEPTGIYAKADQDFFEVDLIEDWGKSEKKHYTFRQDTKDLIFKSGESIRLTQKGVSFYYTVPSESHDIMGTAEMAFSPSMTGISGSVTGEENYKNFYELEYQFVPRNRPSKKLYYEKPQEGQSLSVGDSVFLNTGFNAVDGESVYTEIETDVFGNTIEEVDNITPNIVDSAEVDKEQFIGPSIVSGLFYTLEPQQVAGLEASGVGYSKYMSGEKYLTIPKGGYSSIGSKQINSVYSAGEIRDTFYQGDQHYGDEEVDYALTEYRSFDGNAKTNEKYYYDKPRDIRISQESLCSGYAASERGDMQAGKTKVLDYEYESNNVLRAGRLLNIEGEDGSIKISNLKSNKQEFERGVNLFFEKNYLAELTILATGQDPENRDSDNKIKGDLELLKEIVRYSKDLDDSSVLYLERDIYVDSNVSTQANSNSPSVLSSRDGNSLSPFSITSQTNNPQAVGQEKLYSTQVYQKNDASAQYPFSDPSYFLINHEVKDRFYYQNNYNWEVSDIDLVNTENIYTYQPDNFKCDIINNNLQEGYEAVSALTYQGVSVTGDTSAGVLSLAGSAAGKRDITITPNTGVYYELQARNNTLDGGDNVTAYGEWYNICPALETSETTKFPVSLSNSNLPANSSNKQKLVEIRALEWTKSNITTNKTNIRTTNESPDVLILKSAASNSIYDWSKFEHKITNTSVTTTSDTVSSTSVEAMVFNASGDKLDLGHHRSFNILKGDMSLDFWVRLDDNSGEQQILKKQNALEVKRTSDSEIQFKINDTTITSTTVLSTLTWYHIAVSAKFNKVTKKIDLSIFINGKEDSKIPDLEYSELSKKNNNPLVIGQGLIGKLYGLRLYMGKSLFGNNFTPSAALGKEVNQKRYKLLRFRSERKVDKSNWITNKNSLNNVAPPSDYKDTVDSEDTYHMSEWLTSSAETDNTNSSISRATINYLRNYAYNAPNNPHINKNYEGTPITKIEDIDSIYFNNYKYLDEQEGSGKKPVASPYLYEDVEGQDIALIRSSKKGGNHIGLLDGDLDKNAFSSGSRLRITKYVYKIYTKSAIVLGDLGGNDSYGSEYGWDYQLQYKLPAADEPAWSDIEASGGSFVNNIFYNNEYTDSTSNSFNNIQAVNSIPCVMLKTDITKKHKPEDIEFRIKKKQNVELASDSTKVIKKINFLPLDVTIPTSGCLLDITQQSESTVIDSAGQAVVTLDESREYYLIKDSNETIYKDSEDQLKIETLGTDEFGNITSTDSDLKTAKPIELAGLTGIRITREGGLSNSLESIKTVLGAKPSGLLLHREEKSYLGQVSDSYVTTGELFEVSPEETRTFITPSITGSHFDELRDQNDKIVNFSCVSATTGDAESSITTGVSDVAFSPLDNFYNSPIITSSITATEDDKGKTFIVSGATVTNDVGASVLDIAAEETPVPIATIEAQNDPVIVEDCSNITIDGASSNNVINLSTGDLSVTNGSVNVDDVIIIEHDKIKLTTDDANITGVIDCSSDLILPDGLTNGQHITFLNASNYETKVLCEHSAHTINSKLTDYISPKGAKKFTYNSNNWAISNIETVNFNQLNLTNSDFNTNGNTIIHNEDVDVNITGTIPNNEYVNIVRNQIENFDIESSKESWVAPVMRIFKDGVLKYTAPGNSLGTKIKYNGSYFEFTEIKPIVFNQIAVSEKDSGKAFSYSGEGGLVEFKFAEAKYNQNFEIFLTSKKDSAEDVMVSLSSENESVKFVDRFGDDIGFYFETPLSKEGLVSIKRKDNLTFVIQELDQSDRYKFEQPGVTISSIEESSGTATARSSGAHGFSTGDTVAISGATPVAYNSSFVVTVTGSTTFTFPIATGTGNNIGNDQITAGLTSQRVIINRSEGFGLELPDVSKYTYDYGFDMVFCNMSNDRAKVSLPKNASSNGERVGRAEVDSFKSTNYVYDDSDSLGSDYENFKDTSKTQNYSQNLSDGDFLVLDGSVEDVYIESAIKRDYYNKKEHKYSQKNMESLFNLDGQFVEHLTFANNQFTLRNHELATYQKFVFGCEKVIIAKHYYAGDPDSYGSGSGNPNSYADGDTVLCFDDHEYYITYYNSANYKLTKTNFDYPYSFTDVLSKDGTSSGSKKLVSVDLTGDNNKLFVYIESTEKMYDFGSNTNGLYTVLPTEFSLALGLDDDSSEARKQTYFVKVIDGNTIELYTDSNLETRLEKDDSKLCESFYVKNVDVSSLNIVNVGEEENIKTFSDNTDIVSPLSANKTTSVQQHYSNVYTSGAAVASGVHYATGWNEDLDSNSCSIENLVGKDTIFLTGKFHAKGDLSDSDFNNDYYVNAGLDEVVISNTSDGQDKIKKNRAYKHTSGGTFIEQDQNSSATNASDIIYYPKHELHVLDRKYLSKAASSGFEYNFVFFKPDEHSDDLKIVLPNVWTNLEDLYGSNAGKLAVVNLHERPVRVENFNNTSIGIFSITESSGTATATSLAAHGLTTGDSVTFSGATPTAYNNTFVVTVTGATTFEFSIASGTGNASGTIKTDTGFTLDSDKVAFISSKTNYNSGKTEHTLFNTNTANGYTLDIDEDSKIAKVTKGSSTAEFFIMKPGDIIIDHSIHDDKKILVDGDINFLRPYVSDNTGTVDYGKAAYNKNTKFFISNISKDPINVNINYDSADSYGIDNLTSNGKLHSSKFYTAELAKFASDDDYGEYFTYMEIEQGASEEDSFIYPSADLDVNKKYNVFGVQIPLSIKLHYEKLSNADSISINDYFGFTPEGSDFDAAKFDKITGIGSTGLAKLNIVNTSYEDVSLVISSNDSALSSLVQGFVNEKIRASQGSYRSYTYSGGRFDTYYDKELAPALLPKNRAIIISLAELLSPELSASQSTGCSAFDADIGLGAIGNSELEVYQSPLINIDFKDVKVIKSKKENILFSDASFSGIQKNRAIVSVADGSNLVLPLRKHINRDFDFIIINGSRNSIEITSAEGTGVLPNTSLASGKFIKISYASLSFSTGSPVDCTILDRGIYRKDLRAVVVSRQTAGDSKLLVNKGISSLNIINNSGAELGLKLLGEEETKDINKDYYALIDTIDSSSIKIKSGNTKAIEVIRDGTVSLNKSIYEKQAVLFNDEAIRAFDAGAGGFFKADFVPFIKFNKRIKGEPSVASMSYKGFSVLSGSEIKSIGSAGPVSFSSQGLSPRIGITCRLHEFKLSEVNDKIVLPNKKYDYVLEYSDNISLSLYNVSEDIVEIYKVDNNGDFEYEGGSVQAYKTKDLEGFSLYDVKQASQTVTVTQKEAYIDVLFEKEEVDEFDTDESGENEELGFLSRRFYSNKSVYQGQTIVFKDPFEVNGAIQSNSVFVNASSSKCTKVGGDNQEDLKAGHFTIDFGGNDSVTAKPKYSIIPDSDKVFILTHKADVGVTSVDNLKIANVSNGEINVVDGEENNHIVYSCERADFNSADDIIYSEIRKQRREDWFIRLTDLDIPHLIEDPTYFDEKEWEMEKELEKRGINIDYNGVRYKFSNIFNTNKFDPKEGQTGYQTIENYNDSYRFGVTFLSNQRGVKREVFFRKDISNVAAPIYLKVPWDMKQDVIAYMLSTGHERITKCSHFNERTGEVTFSGIKDKRYHSFESEVEFSYDFTYDLKENEIKADPDGSTRWNDLRYSHDKIYNKKKGLEEVILTYDNTEYRSGEKIEGIAGLKEYKIKFPYSVDLKVSQFNVEDVDDSAENEKVISDEKKDFKEEVARKREGKYTGNIDISSITESSGVATATASTAHGLANGNSITISGATPVAYNNDFVVTVTGATAFTFSITAGTGDAKSAGFENSGSIQATVERNDSNMKAPAWSKVVSNEHKQSFLNAVVERIISSDSPYELIQGRKIKDIQGRYANSLIEKDGNQNLDQHTKNFVFTIPLLEGVTYNKVEEGDEEVEIDTERKEARIKVKLVGTVGSGDASNYNQTTIESPAYEYKIKSSLLFTASESLLLLSLEDKDSIPFSADGTIRSLNEDFSSAVSEEQSVKALDRAKARFEQQTKEAENIKERALSIDEFNMINQREINQRDHKAHLSLKNNHGYSFTPFGVHWQRDPMVGFRFNLERDKPSYRSVRFRLKKLTDKSLVFKDLSKDGKMGTYLTESADKADLQYKFESEVESIAYQDIARPGGVAELNNFGEIDSLWTSVITEVLVGDGGTYIKLNNVDNGDAIVFKKSTGSVVAGRVYFLRIAAWGEDNDDNKTSSNLYQVLNIFDSTKSFDALNLVPYADFSNNDYKIVNYFNLKSQLNDEGNRVEGHRGENPVINKVYDQGLDETQYTSLNFPVVVNNKRFYLERPFYKDYSLDHDESGYGAKSDEPFSSWPDNIYSQNGRTFSVRANLELSAVAEGLITNEGDMGSSQLIEGLNDSGNFFEWHNLDIFESFKNILYRENTQIDIVSYEGTKFKIIIKLTKGKDYRYLIKRDQFPTATSKIFINGSSVDINANKLGYFTCTSEEVEISYEYLHLDDVPEDVFRFDPATNEFKFTENRKSLIGEIYKGILITESAYYVDQVKKPEGNGDPVSVGYMDYQIPDLNNYSGDSDHVLKTPSSFSYTEKLDRIFSFDRKSELLRDSDTEHGLAYDGPLPATVKYIYPRVEANETLSFFVSSDYTKGFINNFESAKSDGSASYRNKPISIKFNLTRLNSETGNWDFVKELSTGFNEKKGVINYSVPYKDADSAETYRLEITKEVFEYYDEGEPKSFPNDLMRLPFNWTSTIYQSDLSESGEDGLFSIGLAENYLLSKSISIPKEGVSIFGSHDYIRIGDNFDFRIPHERLYKYRLSHKLKASYKDKIALGGISRVVIDSVGANYEVAPDVTIASPTTEGVLLKTAEVKAHVESGKIKHIEVTDSGAGYSDISNEIAKQKIIDRRVDGVPFVFHSLIIQEAKFVHAFTLVNGSKQVNYDGSRPVILGASVSGTGIASNTKITKINSSTQFEINNAATSSGSQNLTIDHTEKQMPYIPLSEHRGVETAAVSISYTKPNTGICQEDFGILLEESEALADSVGVEPENTQAIADLKSTLTRYVHTLNSVAESDNWDNAKDLNRKINERENNFNNRNVEVKDHQAFGTTTEDEYSDLQGTENPNFLGVYEANEREEVSETPVTITDDDTCQKEVQVDPTPASLTAIVNNNSIVEYRVVKNEIANTSQPWLSSFSRAQEPSLPKGFGINPGSAVTSEVFNSYAKTVNNMRFLGAHVPVFAKVRKYRKYEYRYVEDMANITFSPAEPTDAGQFSTRIGEFESLSYEQVSKQNYIEFYDHKTKKYKRAWYSGFESDSYYGNYKGVDAQKKWSEGSPFNITDTSVEDFDLNLTENSSHNSSFEPNGIGLPSRVNIPKDNGVFCMPAIYGDASGDAGGKTLLYGEGLKLPNLDKRRAFSFGGELVYSSEDYDVTSETIDTDTSIVNIAGSEIIDASYENEIIFGCQVRGKPFWSTFLKTTIEWTEFEVVPSPTFMKSAIGEDGLGKLNHLNGTVLVTKGICKNEKIGIVDTEQGYHSLCTDGQNRGGSSSSHSYEEYFGLNKGDSVIGPSMQEFEFYSKEKLDTSTTKQTFKIEPEFTQALAVYGSNGTELIVRNGGGGTSNPNFQAGPCVHKCSPFGRKVFIISDEQLRFDLMQDG